MFVGFRLARGGAQEYFGVAADMVTYGKTLGGGFPVGALCGRARFMKRFRDARPADICFARGTFNSHPYVMAAMNEFLQRLDSRRDQGSLRDLDRTWNGRAERLNQRLADEKLPVRVANLSTIWTVTYTKPSRYNWMLQYYLRAEGLALSWVGTGRFIFSLNYSDADFQVVADRFVAAVRAMHGDGFWWTDARAQQRDRSSAASCARCSPAFCTVEESPTSARPQAGAAGAVVGSIARRGAGASGALWYSMMSWNGSVRILVNQTRPVCTPRMKNR